MIKTARILIFTLFLAAFLAQEGHQDSHNDQEGVEVVQIDGPVLAEEAKQQEKVRQKMPRFIIDELKEVYLNRESFHEVESFLFSIPPGGTYDFKYKIQSNSNPSMMIRIFTHQNGDDITILKQHQIDDYLQIFTCANLFGTFKTIAKAHSRKFVNLGPHSGSQLFVRLESQFEQDVIVEVALSGPPVKIDRDAIVTNDKFTVVAKKLTAIQEEMKEVEDINRFKFKFEWGFLEREEHYEEEMLKLTGVEAFVMLATSVVQIYCIKSLFDSNNAIV